jgi:protocatechuate 3,4-dioxygenase beta subunit
MQKNHLLLLSALFVLLVGGAIAMPALLGDSEIPVTRWNAEQEQDVPEASDPAQVATTEGDAVLERSSATPVGNQAIPADERVEVLMRGRVVDKFQRPVAGATVWLDFGRGGRGGGPGGGFGGQGGRQRRVPDPVTTDQEGRFAFQGQAFRNLRVSLQVAHDKHAPGTFDKDVGNVTAEVELGDLVLQNGGEIRGRVTDLEGNGIPAAEVRLSAENGNAMRFVRDRERMLPSLQTDTNGYFRRLHVAAGDWSVTATAKAHTEGRSPTFAVEEDQAVDIEDIRLGPGYEITGTVRDARGQPIAKASVSMQAERTRGNGGGPGAGGQNGGPGGGGRGGLAFAGMGRDHRTTTDERGNFFLEHLPGALMRVSVDADGYLALRVDGVDAKLGQPLQLTMQDGLRIDGIVRDGDGSPVTRFAFRAVRLRGLPQPGEESGGNAMDFGGGRGGAWRQGQDRQGSGGGGDGQGNLDRPERHADGRFRATGLQEGVYEVHVQSPDHARFQSPEIELRAGAPVTELQVALDGGFFVAGAVVDHQGNPVTNARVTMRAPSPFETMGPGRMRGRGNNGNGGAPAAGNGGRSADANGGQAADFAAAGREMQRAANGVQLQFETNTDADGAFVIKHAARGTYRLQAEARGHAMARTEPFELVADRSAQELRLGALATLAGIVRGLAVNELGEARVGAVPIDGGSVNFGGMGRGRGGQGGGQGPFAQATVAADGSYRFDELTPGSYLVRCWVGSPQDLMRELMPQFLSGQLTADVVVQAGQETRFDLQVTRPQLGKVAGNVMVNGAPANGYAVELARLDDNNQPQAGGMGMGRGGRGGGRNQATVSSTGRFEIDKVAVGRYRLRVQTDRRGGALHEEEVFVALDRTTEIAISLQTHSLQGAVTAADAAANELNGRVQLLPNLADLPENLNDWTRENTSYDARLQAGAFKFDAIKPGNYLVVLTVRGRERTSQPVVVSGDQQISLTAGAKSAEPAPGADAQPGAPAPRGAGGNQRGGGGGGGGAGGGQRGGRGGR